MANDRVITSEQILDAVREYPDLRFPEPDFQAFHNAIQPSYEDTARHFAELLRATPARGVAVTLLLDHSGSLRGETACLLASTTGAISFCLAEARVLHEVLGFTTRSWHGGFSRAAWLKTSDACPGRLCDLLHIVHKPFAEGSPLSFEALRRMTLPSLCKENVDGEAIEWAAERLRRIDAQRRILVVLSDGAPVDDATLLANSPDILVDHLRKVTATIGFAQDIEIYALSVERQHWLPLYYPQHAVVSDWADIARIALPMIAMIVANSASAPMVEQWESRPQTLPADEMQVFEIP